MKSFLQKLDNAICKTSSILVSALIGALILLNFTQMITRYVISVTFTWAEEVSILAVLYAAAVGAPWVTLKRKHLKMDAAEKLLGKGVKTVTFWIEHILVIAMGVILLVVGINTVRVNAGFRVSILRFDESVRYIPLVIMGALLILSGVITLLEDMIEQKEGRLVIK